MQLPLLTWFHHSRSSRRMPGLRHQNWTSAQPSRWGSDGPENLKLQQTPENLKLQQTPENLKLQQTRESLEVCRSNKVCSKRDSVPRTKSSTFSCPSLKSFSTTGGTPTDFPSTVFVSTGASISVTLIALFLLSTSLTAPLSSVVSNTTVSGVAVSISSPDA